METTYVTTTIPYVNARPHIGFALELVQADALARYHRLKGGSVRFQTGTDDNALSNVLSARAAGVPVDAFVRENSDAFRSLCGALDISADHFIRTSDATHHAAVRHFLASLRSGDTYEASYRGLYCPRCEDFYLERDADGARCPDHGTALDEVEETNQFFRLERYQGAVRDLIASRRLEILPESREVEVLRFIDGGLRDFSISRSAERAGGWGVPFPGHPGQVVYVWVDALVNYLTGLGYPDPTTLDPFWTGSSRKVHVIGKNVWKFHAVYWPALLLSAGLDVPDRILAHGFLTEDGRKISKSAGNATDPKDFVARYGADAVRYYLLAHVRPFEDTDFSVTRLEAVYRADLANTLGNLCCRLTALCEQAGVGGVEPLGAHPAPAGYHESLSGFHFDQAAAALWNELGRLNREVAEGRPWEVIEAGRGEVVAGKLVEWARRLLAVTHWLRPLLPSTSARIHEVLTAKEIRKCEPPFPAVGRGTLPTPE